MLKIFKPLWRLLVPSLLLLLSIYAVFDLGRISQAYQPLLVYLPYPVLFFAMLLAQQFNRLRLFAAAGIFLLAFIVIQQGLQQALSEPNSLYIYQLLSFLLPVNVLLLALMPERGIWTGHGFLLLLCLLAQVLMAWLLPVDLFLINSDYAFLFNIRPAENYLLSYAASMVFGVAILLLMLLLCFRNSETEAAFLVCLVALLLTLLLLSKAYISAILFTCCGFCIIYCLFRSSHDMAFRDDLTGLRNRRAFNEKLRSLGRHFVIATMDVDHFKKFNDTHGHEVGDDVLRLVAAHIDRVGGGGMAYRYGGEEFCVVFSGRQDAENCSLFLEQVRLSIAAYKMALRNQESRPNSQKQGLNQRGRKAKAQTVSVTVSVGVAQRDEVLRKPDEVLKASDTALYQAKKRGRNCLVIHE